MPRIVHLGFGNFHRAHQAWYTQAAGGDWRITGVSIANPRLRDALRAAQWSYSLIEQRVKGPVRTRISVHDTILVLAEEPDAVVAAVADPQTAIVTLTITEKGYAQNGDGNLDRTAPGVAEDLGGRSPRTALGALTQGLLRRRETGAAPLTVISCDNLALNGPTLRAAVRAFAQALGQPIDAYLDTAVRFPSTMVDRITPATTDALRETWDEPEPVLTEAFSEWVIEDDFAGPRPDWVAAGAIVTPDVAPYEARKLHLLNAAHSLLAYGGLLRGHSFVHEAIADPALHSQVAALWQEAAAVVPPTIRHTLPTYQTALLQRFTVPALRHRLDQIAQDGVQKIPIRILPIILHHHSKGETARAAKGVLVAWLAWRARNAAASGEVPDLPRFIETELDLLGADVGRIGASTDLALPVERLLRDPMGA